MGVVERWRYRRLLARMAGPRLLRAFADAYPHAVFVEIGANDGEQHDHLRQFIREGGWRGVMVEPVGYVFQRLRSNYGAVERVALENAAIGPDDGERPFFHLRDATDEERDSLPDWYDGIGSLSRETLMSHEPQIPDIEERVRESRVPVLRFESLLRKHGYERPDLVLIDTEGYDGEIVRSIDLRARGPRLLVFEHFHLTSGERVGLRRALEDAGYETLEEGFDTFCLRAEADELTRRFRSLKPAVAGVSKEQEAG
jgi:FkbM family methyltransferase